MENVEKIVLCFSPTGSCLKAARAICGQKDRLIDFTLPANRDALPVFSKNIQAVFVLPVYNRSVPDVCRSYIKKLKGNGCNASVICVYGGVTKGKSLMIAAKLLTDSGFVPVKGAYIAAPHFYAKEKINLLSHERLERLNEFLNGNFNTREIKIAKLNPLLSFQPLLKSLTGRCVTDYSECDECGKCKGVCPVNAVAEDFSTKHNCILCGACLNACPLKARSIKFFSPVPPLFIKLNCKHRHDEIFYFTDKNVNRMKKIVS